MRRLHRVCAALALVLIGGCAAPPSAGTERAKIAFMPSPEWCAYREAAARREQLIAEELTPALEFHAFLSACAHTDPQTANRRIPDRVVLAVVRERAPPATQRAALLDQLERALRENPGAASEEALAKQARLGIHHRVVRPREFVGRDDNAVYVAGVGHIRRGQVEYEEATITATTLIARRVVILFLYTDYRDEASLSSLLPRAKDEMARLIRANP